MNCPYTTQADWGRPEGPGWVAPRSGDNSRADEDGGMGKAMNHRALCWLTLAGLVGWAAPLSAFDRSQVEQSVVRIINQSSRGMSTGSGTVINDAGYVLTNHHVIDGNDSLFVISEFSNGEKSADIVWKSSDKDLAIILVPGLELPHATLFTGEFQAGSDVFAMGYPGAADGDSLALKASLSEGIISHFLNGTDIVRGWSVRALQHGATVTGGNSGGPLFDACGRVISVNTARPHIMTGGGRVPDNSQINWASHIKESIRALRDQRIEPSSDDSPCVSAAGGSDPAAARTAEEAKQSAAAAGTKAEEAGSKADQATQTAQDAQVKAAQATQAVEAVVQAGRLTNTLIGLVAVVTLVALGLALRKPRQEIIRVAGKMAEPLSRLAQSARRKKPDIALTGFDTQGRPITLMLSRADLDQQQGGFTVGRHPLLVDQVLNGERLSKRHARFSGGNGSVFVEDLNSSNGTRINGSACPPFQPMQIRPGDMVNVGDIELRVSA